MYIFLGIFLVVAIFCSIIFHFRKRAIICKICNMTACQKLSLLNEVAEPFGFKYNYSQDVITSRQDAWQRDFGYTDLYDQMAARFSMVFECEPVYFNYDNRTWRIELWKGQYGINTGAEIGIYHAYGIVPPSQYDTALFHCAEDSEMMPLSMELIKKGDSKFYLRKTHWWLTAFRMAEFSYPQDIVLKVTITFPNADMLHAFTRSLVRLGYSFYSLCICDLTVSFEFDRPHAKCPCNYRFRSALAQLGNKTFCRLFRFVTRPFINTMDRLLYLYFYLPFAFRRMFNIRRIKRRGRLH